PKAATRRGASSPRSRATNGGRGSGIASPPAAGTALVTPDSTSANGHPSAVASAPSVDGRSPTTTPWSPDRPGTGAPVGAPGVPATWGARPDAATRAATIDPAPGVRSSPSG